MSLSNHRSDPGCSITSTVLEQVKDAGVDEPSEPSYSDTNGPARPESLQ